MKYGFLKVAAAVPVVKVADVDYNVGQVESLIAQAEGQGVEVMVFPELCLTGYSCQDLFHQQLLIDKAEEGLLKLLDFTRKLDVIAIVGLPVQIGSRLFNCAAVIQGGTLLGIVPKTFLPNYSEFYEKRWFASANELTAQDIYLAGSPVHVTPQPTIFTTCDGARFGIEICEDVWAPMPPSVTLALEGADVILNLSASDELIGKHQYLCQLLAQQSARTISGYVYAGCGFGESTQDVVYGGNAMIFENGKLLCEGERFSFQPQIKITQIDVERLRTERRLNSTFNTQPPSPITQPPTPNTQHQSLTVQCRPISPRDFELVRTFDPHPFIPTSDEMQSTCDEILNIQVAGLAKRLYHIGLSKAIIGISGGLDSTLALLVTVKAFDKLGLDRRGIIGITMPGFGTTDRTHQNALKLMEQLGVTIREISIAKAVTQHFEDIGHDAKVHDATYENSQARERTQILMDVANKENAIVVGTGDLSELALGWATYNGDHMSMYGVNAGVPKTLVRHLVTYLAGELATEVLLDIVDTPISPELTPADEHGQIKQKTEDLVGPYELHDFFIYYFMRFGFRPSKIFLMARKAFDGKYDDEVIKHWLTVFCRRFFSQQFKRSCMPDGPKVGSVSLSPRGDWRMPSDASSSLWLKDVERRQGLFE